MGASRFALLIALAACGKRDEHKATPATPGPTIVEGSAAAAAGCERMPFEETTPVPEASGAAWLEIDGAVSLVVVADSGHDGAFGVLDPETGKTRLQGVLPLGTGASDDIEGLAARGNRLFGITSSGFMREWAWQGGAFVLVAGPYPIGGAGMVCKNANQTNCGNNYEGLALAPAPIGGCDAYACSKETGAMHCLAEQGGKLVATGAPAVQIVERKDVLADCTFGDRGELYVGNNLFGLSHTYRVDNLADPAHVKITDLGPLGTGFPETVAARGDIVYRMSDMGGTGPSLMLKFRCTAPEGYN